MGNKTSYEVVGDRTLKLPIEVARALLGSQEETAEAIRETVERTAPQKDQDRIGHAATVVSGRVRTSGRMYVRVGLAGYWAYLGPFHEFGTVKMPAHPFMQPAAEAQVHPFEERATEAARRVLEE